MTYTINIPTAGQTLGNSRPDIQRNFNYIDTAFAINHVAFNNSNVGKHKFLQMPEQGAAPVTAADEGALYTKEAGGRTNLFWRLESNGTQVQMTNIAPVNATSGYSFLPGGLLIQWQTVTLNGTTNTPVVFPVAFDVATTPYSIQLTWAVSPSNITLGAGAGVGLSNTGFNLRSSSASSDNVYVLSIGKRTT